MKLTRWWRFGALLTAVMVIALVGSLVATLGAGPPDDPGGPSDLHGRANVAFEVDGVVFTDVDESSGRLIVGVVNLGLSGQVGRRLQQAGIALGGVDFVQSDPYSFATTLRDRVRPVQGGLQVNFDNDGDFTNGSWLCTYGFNAVRSGTNGFVTNSHCTATRGVVEGTKHHQALFAANDANLVGTEIADPAFFNSSTNPSCPKNKVCRYSDSAYDALAVGVLADLGKIARTTGPNNGSLDIAGSFQIAGEKVGNAYAGVRRGAVIFAPGDLLGKVGRTTGWTQGNVTNSCANVGVSGTNVVMLCQDLVSAGVGGGDSGSPVFSPPDANNNVTLYGILWGGNSLGTSFVYSPMSNVQRSDELGELTTQ